MTPIEWTILGVTLAVSLWNGYRQIKEAKDSKAKWEAVSTVIPAVMTVLKAADEADKKEK